MEEFLGLEQRRELARRGFSRRDFGRLAALLAAGAAPPFYNEAALAQGLSAFPNLPPDAVRLNANENPLGPCPEAAEAIHKVVQQGGRYLYGETFAFVGLLAHLEGLPKEYVLPFAGSSDPLHRAVLAFSSPGRSFVVADPRIRSRRASRLLHRCQDGEGSAPQGRFARWTGNGPGRP